ncbi:MAG: hypothetical protein ACI828_000852 [Flavobacteriales bacterium]|jgi:hypothetical protein
MMGRWIHTYPDSLLIQKGATVVKDGVHTQIVEKNAGIPVDNTFSESASEPTL